MEKVIELLKDIEEETKEVIELLEKEWYYAGKKIEEIMRLVDEALDILQKKPCPTCKDKGIIDNRRIGDKRLPDIQCPDCQSAEPEQSEFIKQLNKKDLIKKLIAADAKNKQQAEEIKKMQRNLESAERKKIEVERVNEKLYERLERALKGE